MKINHKQKLRLARSMMTQEEIKNRVSPFRCLGWMLRKMMIAGRVQTEVELADKRRAERGAVKV